MFFVDGLGFVAEKKFSFWLAELPFDSKIPYNCPAPGVHREQNLSYFRFFIFQNFRDANYYYISQDLPACRDACKFGFGKKIFEGDIVRYGEICGEVKFGLHESNWQICKYNQGFYIEFPEESLYRKELGYWENKVVVIGNIYDSPKLLEDKENKHGEDI